MSSTIENKLLDKFQQKFQNLDKSVKEEELLQFLDSNSSERFDRSNFRELLQRLEFQDQTITPKNFVKVYHEATEVLRTKTEHVMTDLNGIDRSIKQTKMFDMFTVTISNLTYSNWTAKSNYITFDLTKNSTVNFYSLDDETSYMCVPKGFINQKEPLRLTLYTDDSKFVDSKNVTMPSANEIRPYEVALSNGGNVKFSVSHAPIPKAECLSMLEEQKKHLEEYQVLAVTKRKQLIDTFPDVFSGGIKINENGINCSSNLIITSALTALMLIGVIFLNFTRCMFIDILIATTYFLNIYVNRNFNVFLSIRLIVILVFSILIDVTWETLNIIHYRQTYEVTEKSLRIFGFVLSGIVILIKLLLLYFYFILSKEDHVHGYLGLNDENSVYDVDEKDYLRKSV